MTDHLDDLASAHLDGIASPEEAAEISTRADALARLEAMRAVRAALRDPAPVHPARREQAIAAALAAFDEDDHAVIPPPVPTSLASAAARRRPPLRTLRLVGAAAAVVLLAALVPVLGRLADSGSDDSTAARATLDPSGGATESDEQSTSAPDAGPGAYQDAQTTTTAGTSSPVELGEFASIEALVAALAVADGAADPTGEAVTTWEEIAGLQCLATARSDQVASATATIAGASVAVVIRTLPTGERSVLVYSVPACELLADQPLAAG